MVNSKEHLNHLKVTSVTSVVYLSALNKQGLCTDEMGGKKTKKKTRSKDILNSRSLSVSSTQIEALTYSTCSHNLQQISTHLFYQSSVAQVAYRLLTLRRKNKTCTKQRLDRSDNSSGLCIHFRDKNNYSKINPLLQINNFAKDFYCSNITQELTPKVPQITRLDVEVYQSLMSAVC